MVKDIGHWEFHKEFDIDNWVGFIYKITDLVTQKEYIGKKFFFSTLRKKGKGRINRKVIRKESVWKKYTSSSRELNAQIIRLGKDKFKFEILSLHETKSSLAYREVELQILENVM